MPAPMDIEQSNTASRRGSEEEKKGRGPLVLGLLAVAILGVVIVIAWSLLSGGGTHTTAKQLVVTSKVEGVDYQKLIGDSALKHDFTKAVISYYLGKGNFYILPGDLAVELSAGSVIVKATINWKPEVEQMDFGATFHKGLATKVDAVAGEAKSGEEVTAVFVSKVVEDGATSGGEGEKPGKAAELKTKFERMANRMSKGKPTNGQPTNADKLALYALYKQALVGDCNIPRPSGMLPSEAKTKWDAWNAIEKGMSKEDAMKKYIAEAMSQISHYGISEVEDDKVVV